MPVRFPVIISVDVAKKSFNDFSFQQRATFIKELEQIYEPVKNTYLATRGDLFIHPVDEMQKERQLLLNGNEIAQIKINISETKTKTE